MLWSLTHYYLCGCVRSVSIRVSLALACSRLLSLACLLRKAVLEAKGRHDPCVLPRAPPLIEAMGSLVIADAAVGQMARVAAARAMLSAGPSDLTYFPVTSIDTRADPKDREQDGHPAAKRAKTK